MPQQVMDLLLMIRNFQALLLEIEALSTIIAQVNSSLHKETSKSNLHSDEVLQFTILIDASRKLTADEK